MTALPDTREAEIRERAKYQEARPWEFHLPSDVLFLLGEIDRLRARVSQLTEALERSERYPAASGNKCPKCGADVTEQVRRKTSRRDRKNRLIRDYEIEVVVICECGGYSLHRAAGSRTGEAE